MVGAGQEPAAVHSIPNVSASQYSTSAFEQTVRDDKGSVRIDGNSRLGQISASYFVDDIVSITPIRALLQERAIRVSMRCLTGVRNCFL